MSDAPRTSGGRGIALVAVTYIYFLIFAQFAFLGRLAQLGIAGPSIKMVMAAMAGGGIFLSLLAPRITWLPSPAHRLRIAFAGCGLAAGLTMLRFEVVQAACIAALIGATLGLLTVTLVTDLRRWTGDRHPILKVGWGTGIGYFICNIPAVFAGSAQFQAAFAALLCIAGFLLTFHAPPVVAQPSPNGLRRFSFGRALACFAVLVWLDSAAFFIIQHAPALKAGTWLGAAHLWTNAFLHLAAAIAAAYMLQRRGLGVVIAAAFASLAFACLLLSQPALIPSASLFYPVGVSLYSVALVAYPAFLAQTSNPAQRARQAGWIYAIAGWIGSALGIGMGQNLGHVPTAFVAVAGSVVLLPTLLDLARARTREIAVLCIALAFAFLLYRLLPSPAQQSLSAAERGRRVYIAEGCIHCHSQYVRPDTADVLMWGPTETLDQVHSQRPPLIGNRRQGPDLAQVGARRSPLWLKIHLIDPAEVSGDSVMPSYAFLFRDPRGDDLVAYLISLGSSRAPQHQAAEQAWQPDPSALASDREGAILYGKLCATCHEPDGATHAQWHADFRKLPTNLLGGPFAYLHPAHSVAERRIEIAHIVKFGIAGTDMPGHEYLSDRQITSLSLWLTQNYTQPASTP